MQGAFENFEGFLDERIVFKVLVGIGGGSRSRNGGRCGFLRRGAGVEFRLVRPGGSLLPLHDEADRPREGLGQF